MKMRNGEIMSRAVIVNILKPAVVSLLAVVYAMTYAVPAYAATLTSASLTLGDPRTSTTSTYTVQASGFTTGTTINCIQLDVGTAVDGTGDAGLDLSSITLDSTTIPSSGSWTVGSVDGATDQMQATLVAGATPNASGNIVWGGVVNGATEGTTYYGLLETYSNTDCSTGGPVDSVVTTFVYKDGELVTLTIDPTLTFSCAGVASGQDVFPSRGASSVDTTVLSNASGIDHSNNVTSSTNGISAHDLTTATNASGGYNVYIRHTQDLINGALDTISNGTLTADPFPAPGTESWAWTTDDDDVGTYNDTDAGNWESFSATNATIASAAGVDSSTDRVGHQVGVATTTPAGTYTTTIVYTAVATY